MLLLLAFSTFLTALLLLAFLSFLTALLLLTAILLMMPTLLLLGPFQFLFFQSVHFESPTNTSPGRNAFRGRQVPA